MPHSVLVVDDEKDIVELLKYNLEREHFKVLTAHDGVSALERLKERPDVCILDVMMPDLNGWDVCRRMKADPLTADIPVIFLTARDSEVDEVLGLELGAADYVAKPVKIRTLLARVRKVLLDASHRLRPGPGEHVLNVGTLKIHADDYRVRVGALEIRLPKKEFEVLLYLARHPDRVISRSLLLNAVWGHDVYVVDRTIDVHIRRIREKLGPAGSHIETVKGVGYRFRSEPS